MAQARTPQRTEYTIVFNTSSGATSKLSYEELRRIYDNREPNFLYGSFMAAPIVDLLNSFVGAPSFVTKDKDAQMDIDQVLEDNAHAMTEVQRMAFRDGKAYLRIAWEIPAQGSPLYGKGERTGRLVLIPISADRVVANKHPLSGDIIYAEILDAIELIDEHGTRRTTRYATQLTPAREVVKLIDGPAIEGIELPDTENAFGAVPMIEFVNDPDPATGEGVSEIARIAPLIAVYHDVLDGAVQASKLHSTPKPVIKVKDPARFQKLNFGNTKQLDLSSRGGFLVEPDETVEFLEANNAIGSSIELLKKIFYCMVITAETPEYALGVHMSSSYASTAEQTPVWQMKVRRKQQLFSGYWAKAVRMMLAKLSYHANSSYSSFASQVLYDLPDISSAERVAVARETTVRALSQALDAKLISWAAAVETMRDQFPEMRRFKNDEGDSERDGIIAGMLELQKLDYQQAPVSSELADIDSLIAQAEAASKARRA